MAEWRNVTEEKYWGVTVIRSPVPYVPRPRSEIELTWRQIREIEKEKELRKRLIMQNGYYPQRNKLIRILEEAFVILFSVTVAVALTTAIPPLPYAERGPATVVVLMLLIAIMVADVAVNARGR
jgi:sterol desaturase/sphingolipid hydroxylase (fatty acid hydroxylase superfamily)